MLSLKYIGHDFRASVVVFLVALPLCLGIALASNAPLSAGLIAGLVGGFVVASISDSRVSVSGPAAGLTVIVAGAITAMGSYDRFALVVVVAGILQFLFGVFRGGTVGEYFPSSVIKGMLASIGLMLILKQLPHAFGYDADYMGDESFGVLGGTNTFSDLQMALEALSPGAIIVSVCSIFVMVLWDRGATKGPAFFRFIPGALVAVLMGVLFNWGFAQWTPDLVISKQHLVQLPSLLAGLTTPDWSAITDLKVYRFAFTLAIVASLESLLSLEAADKLESEGRVSSKNRELIAQGVGNTVSGLLGGLPVTAVIVRTSANITAGARTRLSAILHGGWLLLSILTIPQILNMIPLASLASVLLLVGLKLTKPSLYKQMFAKGRSQFLPFITTIVAVLLTDLLVGIIIGMFVGFYYVIRAGVKKSIVVVREGNQVLVRFHKDVSFLQRPNLDKILREIPEGSSVLIDGSRGVFIDDDIIDHIEDFIKRAETLGMQVRIKRSSLALNDFFKEDVRG